MKKIKLAELEAKFADLVWNNEPINSGELVKLCEKELNWKKSTTYTVLKKLCERGIFKNNDAIVTSCIKKEKFNSYKSEQFVEETFGGSLPRFLTAFIGTRHFTEDEINELKLLIDNHKER